MRSLLLPGLLLAGLCVSLRSEEVKTGPLAPFGKNKDGKEVAQNVPGSFHPFNVTARVPTPEEQEELDKAAREQEKDDKREKPYTSVDKFHCLVTEYDLDPVVMLFARGLSDSEGFRELLTKLDAACTKYRVRRLRAFVVFVDDKAKDYTADDAARKEKAAIVRKVGEDLKLANVVLTIDTEADLAKYQLSKSALTAVLYRALGIRNSHVFNADDLDKKTSPAIDALLKDVDKHLVAK